ncbi:MULTISPECIES: hypothetical protein [Micromonospora]|uniref:hypothetical protein n=1 Tax=Micromonospora TaxID=1873 RepID=UPI0011B6C183|nr:MULTISPECIES: hypothetical protein [unclassified Micromonospora]MBM0225209.1 hypothetical protein [Micromonospora sp. ATA51]
MSAVLGALEFHDHQPAAAVDAEQVDSSPYLEVTELLGDDQQVLPGGGDVLAKRALKVRALQDLLGGKGGGRHGNEFPADGHLEQAHPMSLSKDRWSSRVPKGGSNAAPTSRVAPH